MEEEISGQTAVIEQPDTSGQSVAREETLTTTKVDAPEGGTEDKNGKLVPYPTSKIREDKQTISQLKQRLAQMEADGSKRAESTLSEPGRVLTPDEQAELAMEKIAEKVHSRLAPTFRQQDVGRFVDEIEERPFAKDIQEEIVEAYGKTDASLDVSKRMDMAYKLAMGDAAMTGKLEKLIGERAKTEAYDKIAEKTEAGSTRPTAGKAHGDDIDVNNLSSQDYQKSRREVFASLGLGDPDRH